MGRGRAVLVMATAVAVLAGCGDDKKVDISSSSSSSSSSTTELATTSSEPTTTVVTAPATTARPTTTVLAAERKCETATGTTTTNTTWSNYYSSDPGPNSPATVTVCIDDIHPKAGHKTVLTVSAKDPDATIAADDECAVYVSWESDPGNLCYDVLIPPGTGPKPAPPARQAGAVDKTVNHTYAKAGDFKIEVEITTGGDPHRNPYTSGVTVTLPIHVRP
jgi:hypothetical protein